MELKVKNSSESYVINPTKIICLGLNYASHVKEHDIEHATNKYKEPPKKPILFLKTPNCLIGPHENIVYPNILKEIEFPRMDYEGELAVIMKKRAKNVKKEKAFDYILGYTCFNDVTARDMQRHDISSKKPWFRSKSLDTFGPIGPLIVKTEDIKDPNNLKIETILNDEVVQSANTKDMVFKVDFLIEYISNFFTLKPGDIIVTGTPSGIGPLQPKDKIEVRIERIGTLKNQVIEEIKDSRN
ncbi:MAG: hypothetical protein GF364_17995 [Candidatus Lokiarchaeota archaeon]|nr:hypothetical protein [Candidatus Lokiarchaeota archaeon]